MISVKVDGSEGAKLNPGNGIIFQLMEDDDPGPVMPAMTNTGVYNDPTDGANPDTSHNIYAVTPNADALATFSDIDLDRRLLQLHTRRSRPRAIRATEQHLAQPLPDVRERFGDRHDHLVNGEVHQQAHDRRDRLRSRSATSPTQLLRPSTTVSSCRLTKGSEWVVTRTSYLTGLTHRDGQLAQRSGRLQAVAEARRHSQVDQARHLHGSDRGGDRACPRLRWYVRCIRCWARRPTRELRARPEKHGAASLGDAAPASCARDP